MRKNLLDSVPKAIMHFLVNSVRANIQEELVIELYREDEFADMLREADDAVRRRQNRPSDIWDAPDRHTQRMAKPDQKSQRKTAERQRDQGQQDRHTAAKRHDRPTFAGDPLTVGCVIHDRAVLHDVRR